MARRDVWVEQLDSGLYQLRDWRTRDGSWRTRDRDELLRQLAALVGDGTDWRRVD